MAKVKITLEYDYEGDATTNTAAQTSEKEFWTSGAVGLEDIIAGGDNYKFEVEIVGDIAEELQHEDAED